MFHVPHNPETIERLGSQKSWFHSRFAGRQGGEGENWLYIHQYSFCTGNWTFLGKNTLKPRKHNWSCNDVY